MQGSTNSPKSNSHLKLLGARRVTRSELYTGKVHPRTGHEGPEGESRGMSQLLIQPRR